MYHTRTGSYDEIPEGMMYYINNYGPHFNKKLCKEASSRMYKEINGKKYVNVDTNQDIFTGKSLAEQTKIAKKYIFQVHL